MLNSPSFKDVVVLTTPERSSLYTSVLGDEADMRFQSLDSRALEGLLHNVSVARGSLVIIDEAFFENPDDMPTGLERFVINEGSRHRPRIIVVCAGRVAGDGLLAHLVLYFGIYNIIYGRSDVETVLELERLIDEDNVRDDVLHLADAGKWESAKRYFELAAEGASGDVQVLAPARRFERVSEQHIVNVENVKLVNIKIEIEPLWA